MAPRPPPEAGTVPPPDPDKTVHIPICPGCFLSALHKNGSEPEKRRISPENGENASLHLEIGMIVLYLVKVGPFWAFPRKIQFFPAENGAFFTFFDFNQSGRLPGAALGQNKQGGSAAPGPAP